MKEKIKNALQQGHKNLGLSEELFERVAAFAETFVTEESGIESFVTSDKTADLLKSYQSVADKARAQAMLKNEPKPTDPEPDPAEPKQAPKDTKEDIAAIVAAAVAKAIDPLQSDFANFKAEQTQKGAIAALDEYKQTWDYAQGYPSESEDAYEATIELYEAGGKKWTADELKAKYKDKFNKLVSRKGVDITQPYKGEGGTGSKTDFSDMAKRLKAQGIDLGK